MYVAIFSDVADNIWEIWNLCVIKLYFCKIWKARQFQYIAVLQGIFVVAYLPKILITMSRSVLRSLEEESQQLDILRKTAKKKTPKKSSLFENIFSHIEQLNGKVASVQKSAKLVKGHLLSVDQSSQCPQNLIRTFYCKEGFSKTL